MKFVIEGILRTTSPMHITAPGERKCKLPNDNKPNAPLFPMQAVQRMRLPAVLDEVAAENEEEQTTRYRVPEVPIIPANSIRGRLRRFCAFEVFDVLKANKEKLTLDTYNTLLCGAATGSLDSNPPTLSEISEANDHPFIGLWGGGPRMLHSKLRVDTAYPICEDTRQIVPSMIDSGFAAAGTGRDLVQTFFRRRNDDILSFANPKYAEATVEDFLNAIDEYQNERAKPKSDNPEDESTRGVRSFTAYEVVSPNVPFRLAFDIHGDYAQLGLFLNGLRRLIHDQSMGGMGRLGYGRFEVLNLMISEVDSNKSPVPVFADSMDSKPVHQRYNFSTESLVQTALKAWNESKKTLSAGQLEQLYRPAPPKKGKEK